MVLSFCGSHSPIGKTIPLRKFCRDRCTPAEQAAIDAVINELTNASATWANWVGGWAHHRVATEEEADRRVALMVEAGGALDRELAAIAALPSLTVTGINTRAQLPRRVPVAAPLLRRGRMDWLEQTLTTDRHFFDDLAVEEAGAAPRPLATQAGRSPDAKRAPETPRRKVGRPSAADEAMAEFDERYPGGVGMPGGKMIRAAEQIKEDLGLDETPDAISRWISKHLGKRKKTLSADPPPK